MPGPDSRAGDARRPAPAATTRLDLDRLLDLLIQSSLIDPELAVDVRMKAVGRQRML